MTHVFSSTAFLESLAAARFPAKRATIGMVQLGTHRFRMLTVAGRAIVDIPWLDFVEPLDPSEPMTSPVSRVSYVPRVALQSMAAAEWQALDPGTRWGRPSPYVQWGMFPRFEDFSGGARAGVFSRGRRRWRQISKEIGEARYLHDDEDPAAFGLCIEWKRAQYRASGFPDALADPATLRLFRELRDRGLLTVSTLRAGTALVAVHVCLSWEKRLYSWIPTYNPEHGRFSGGRVLLEAMLAASHARGDHEFDFLLGDEAYKWDYATHTRVVGPLGNAPLSLRAQRLAKQGLKRALGLSPRLWDVARRLRRLLRSA